MNNQSPSQLLLWPIVLDNVLDIELVRDLVGSMSLDPVPPSDQPSPSISNSSACQHRSFNKFKSQIQSITIDGKKQANLTQGSTKLPHCA